MAGQYGRLVIGTSGWMYRGWKGPFYPPKLPTPGYLSFYSSEFESTEVNCTFYTLPDPRTIRRWAATVPESFVFAVKANRFITHTGRLAEDNGSWEVFLTHARELGSRLGPILLQFPPTWRRDLSTLRRFLARHQAVHAAGLRLAMEFRHPSWYAGEVYRTLAQYEIGFCIADGIKHPRKNVVTSSFAYLRYHGQMPREAPCYADHELREEAALIRRYLAEGLDVYAYFNNDALGHAVANARRLKTLVDRKACAS